MSSKSSALCDDPASPLSCFFLLDFLGSSDDDEAHDALARKTVGDVDLGLNLVDDFSRDLTSAPSDEALDVLALDVLAMDLVGDDEFRDL